MDLGFYIAVIASVCFAFICSYSVYYLFKK
mgnify:CR=1 FL=1